MMNFSAFQAFMRQYFPIFLTGLFVSILSMVLAVALWVDNHWRDHPDNSLYTLLTCGVLSLLLCVGHFAMIRGLGWAIWVVLLSLALTWLMALSLVGTGLSPILLTIVTAMPLLAVLVLNSSRHREMRRGLAHLREQRRAARKP